MKGIRGWLGALYSIEFRFYVYALLVTLAWLVFIKSEHTCVTLQYLLTCAAESANGNAIMVLYFFVNPRPLSGCSPNLNG